MNFTSVVTQSILTDAESMRRLKWAEQIPLCRVLDALALLLGPEVVGLTICLHIKEIILVATQPQRKACLLPEGLEELFPLFWRVIEGVMLRKVVSESCKAALAKIKHLRVIWSESILLLL